jgi:hypothetical protein
LYGIVNMSQQEYDATLPLKGVRKSVAIPI